MSRLIYIATLAASLTANVPLALGEQGQKETNPFYHVYSAVSTIREEDPGKRNLLMALRGKNQDAADFVAKFWWGWGVRGCDDHMDRITDFVTKYYPNDPAEGKKWIVDEFDLCVMSFSYQHWDDIQKSIQIKSRSIGK